MVLLNFWNIEKRFVSKTKYKKIVSLQKKMNLKTLDLLKKYGITENSELKLEIFFYTNELNKANNLVKELKKLNYKIETVDNSAHDTNQFVITGWTTKIKLDLQSLLNWTTKMCDIGFDCDCEFDGWGTYPDQDIEIEENLSAEEYFDKGLNFYFENKFRKSELYFTKSIELDSTFEVSFYNRGNVRAALGNHEQAIEDYTNALKIKPDYYEAFENRGSSKDDIGVYEEAISDYTNALKINPKSTVSYTNRGNSKYRKGDKKGAYCDWQKALELGDINAKEKLDKYCK
jgi:tetratricopeptide (TPR) repeat protein